MRYLVPFGVWLLMIVSYGYGSSADCLMCTGVLQGYFLTQKGEVVLRSINLSTQTLSEQPKEELYLLWAGYYFEGKVKSARPIQSVSILAGNHVIWKREFPKAILQGAVPDLKLPLQLHTRYGSDWKVRFIFDDGTWVALPLQPIGVRFKPPLPLKIDWLDLVRIHVVKTFLACYGDHLFPGWNAERIPFALLGDEGQWVFINHPNPPKGAKRYRGPCPLKADIHWIDKWLEFDGHPEAAETLEINGVHTVVLPFRPYWFALPDYETRRNAPEALMRLATILHECFHAWYNQQPFQELAYSVPFRLLATNEFFRLINAVMGLESELLNQALTTQDLDKRNDALRSFLALRRFPPDKPEYQVVVEANRKGELSEGVASILEEQAFQLLTERWQEYYPSLSVDPFLPQEPMPLPVRWRGYPASHYFTGAAQLTLLERSGLDWKQNLRATGFKVTLDELLAKAVNWQGLSQEQQSKLAQAIWKRVEERLMAFKQSEEETQEQGFEEFRKRLREEKLGLWVKVEFPKDMLRRFPPPKVPLDGQWQESLHVSAWDCHVNVSRLCWVSQETMQSLVARVYLPMDKDEIFWFRWRGSDLEVKGEGLRLYVPQARFIETKECLWLVGQSRSLSGENPLWARKAIDTKRSAWLAASLSLLLAVSGNVQAQVPEGVTITATITGNFRDADTGQIAYLTLDGIDETNNPPGNWHAIVGEQYTYNVVMETAQPEEGMSIILLNSDGQELARAESAEPTQRLAVYAKDTSSFGCQKKLRFRLEFGLQHFPPCKIVWGPRVVVEEYHVSIPPPQFGTVIVHVFDGTNNQPLPGAFIEIPEAGIQAETNPQGIWSGTIQVDPKKGKDITIRIFGPSQSQVWCQKQFKVKLYAQGTFETSVWLWPHYPISGRITFDGPGGDPQQATVKATKGGQTLTGVVNLDGSFVIPGFGGAPEAGDWTVTVTYPGAESITPPSRTITVPNNCGRTPPAIPPFGSHSPLDAGEFVIKLPFPGGPGG